MPFDRITESTPITLGIVGTGIMGRGIAQIAAQAGIQVLLYDSNPTAAVKALGEIRTTLHRLFEKGKLSQTSVDSTLACLTSINELAGLAICDFVVEAIFENLDAKWQVIRDLEGIVGSNCIIATNTSSLSVTSIAAAATRPDRIAGWHFFNPVPLMKVVEIIPGLRTQDQVTNNLATLSQRIGHYPVRCQDTPGFIVNHAGRGYVTEALRIVSEGIADFATVDRILRDGLGFRMGPFELLDLTGLDVSHPVMEQIYHQFYQEPRFRPSPITRQRLDGGVLGRKTGLGFYTYKNGIQLVDDEIAIQGHIPESLWLAPDVDAPLAQITELAARHKGLSVAVGGVPSVQALCVVFPMGEDVTDSIARYQLHPERTVALDPITPFNKRRTLMKNPLTAENALASAYELFSSDGVPVSVIKESAGFVAQRVIASIVNIASDIAQQRLATPNDIDMAVRLGLGYPQGPLSWGTSIGPSRIVRILENMNEFYGDPRYRVSPWLKRRMRLNISLHICPAVLDLT